MAGAPGSAPAAHRTFGRPPTRDSGFPRDSLSVTIKATGAVWRPGDAGAGNLNGTYSSLDCYSTPMQCLDVYHNRTGTGVLSRDGWAVLDDTMPNEDDDLLVDVRYGGEDEEEDNDGPMQKKLKSSSSSSKIFTGTKDGTGRSTAGRVPGRARRGGRAPWSAA